jgi:hypothetical protein
LGHEAYSCDIEPCSGGHPEWHLQQDVTPLLRDPQWDLILAFPPCTYLTIAGTSHFSRKVRSEEYIQNRTRLRQEAYTFFLSFFDSNCPFVAVENPVGYVNSAYRKPDQIIHPYFFGDPFLKRTCLWLRGLLPLQPTNILTKPDPVYTLKNGEKVHWSASLPKTKDRSKVRSVTFPGIADAMANQWASYVEERKSR